MRLAIIVLVSLIASACGAPDTETPVSEAERIVDEAAGLEAIREIRRAQSEFMARQRRYAQFVDELVDGLLLPEELPWSNSGYAVRIMPTPAADGYRATVTAPVGETDVRSFYVDDSGVIRFAVGAAATADSPELTEENP